MASGPQVGTAWIAITPSFQGFASSLLRDLTGDLTQAGRRAGDDGGRTAGDAFGSSFSDSVSGLADSLAGPGAVAGAGVAAAFGVGMAQAMDTSAATTRLTAQLDLTAAEAQRAGDIAGEVFSAGFGDSMGTVSEALRGVHTNIGALGEFTDAELETMTTSALALAETFDQDVSQATVAVGQLMKTGLADSATEAFDIITAGFQSGADRSGDLLDTITEYSTQFRNMGIDGEQAMGLISQGLQAGARDADVVADTIKEFSIEAVQGSEDIGDAWDTLGLNSDELFEKIGAGGESANEALAQTLDALREWPDEIERGELAVELFGTKAEDMGAALFALDPATATLEDVAGAAGDLNETLADDPARTLSGAWRELSTQLGEALLPVLTTVADFARDHPSLFGGLALALLGVAGAVAAVTAALWAVNLAVAANPITWVILGVIAGVALLAGAVALVIMYWDEIVAATRAAWEWVRSAVTGAWQAVSGATSAAAGAVSGAVSAAWQSVQSATSGVWSAVQGAVSGAWSAVRSTASSGATAVRDTVSGAWTAVRTATSRAWTAVRTSVVSAILGAWTAVSSVGSWFVSVGRAIVSGIISGVTSAASGLFNSLRSLASSALDSAKSFLGIGSPSRLFEQEVGQWIPAGVQLGVEDGEPELTRAVEHMVQVPDPPTVRATVATGRAAAPAPVVEIVAGDRHLMAWLENAVRTRYAGDITRVGAAR